MRHWWNDLDRVLRGQATRADELHGGRLELPLGRLSLVLVLLGMIYGLCMGSFTLWRAGGPVWMQLLATTLKVPALYLLTLFVTFPSLYVFNALVGSRLDVTTVFCLLIASLVVAVAVLASLGPIVAFFGASTTSYAFMKLLNVAVFAVSGALGLTFLLRTLQRLSEPMSLTEIKPDHALGDEPQSSLSSRPPGPLDANVGQALSPHVKAVFRSWVILFGLVGAQMAWMLRPFLGNPSSPFTWFRARDANFFQAVFQTIMDLFKQ